MVRVFVPLVDLVMEGPEVGVTVGKSDEEEDERMVPASHQGVTT